jgi:predicted  nucleic acid-binding Zn-ribbon protein
MIDVKCNDCGRARKDGWLLIDGRCANCGPEAFESRRRELKAQARLIVQGSEYLN